MFIGSQYLVYGAIFLCSLLLIEGVYYLFFESVIARTNANRRMQMLAAGVTTREVYEQLVRRPSDNLQFLGPLIHPYLAFDRMILHAGIQMPTPRILVIIATLWGTIFFSVLVLGRATNMPAVIPLPLAALIAATVLGAGLPFMRISSMKHDRLKKFGEQLPDGLDVMVRSLQAGHPVSAAMNLLTKEMPDPIGSEFGIAVDEMTYGLDLREALSNLADRVPVQDFQYVVVSIGIQSDTGGNLAEVLAGLSTVIRERFRLFRKVKALSGEGRMSAMILSLLPFVTVGVIFTLAPSFYLNVLDDPMFLPIAGGAFALMLTGIYIMYRMVNFRV